MEVTIVKEKEKYTCERCSDLFTSLSHVYKKLQNVFVCISVDMLQIFLRFWESYFLKVKNVFTKYFQNLFCNSSVSILP